MKELYIAGAIMFIVITLGFVDVGIRFSDGTNFSYRGWSHLFLD